MAAAPVIERMEREDVAEAVVAIASMFAFPSSKKKNLEKYKKETNIYLLQIA